MVKRRAVRDVDDTVSGVDLPEGGVNHSTWYQQTEHFDQSLIVSPVSRYMSLQEFKVLILLL